jgi:glutamate--cysteine ligase
MPPLPTMDDTGAVIEKEQDLEEYFDAGSKPRERWGVGLEWERFGLVREGLSPAPYEGERSVESLLKRLVQDSGWEGLEEDGRLLGARKGGTRITLEPGAQLEISGGVHKTLDGMRRELSDYIASVETASSPLGLRWAGIGMQPLAALDQIPWIPKKRYAIMREYLPKRGSRGHIMMKQTACIQANLDYGSEADAMEKMRTAMGVSPLVTALFANSPLTEGKSNGMMSGRAWAWRDTDPDRCGLLPFVFRDGARFGDYLEYALEVPLFFVARGGAYHPGNGLTFRRFIRRGLDGERATFADFELHLTTLFPEARLKRYIELRGADSGDPAACMALAALWKGLLYDGASRREAWELVREMTMKERNALLDEICRRGPEARMPGERWTGGSISQPVLVRDVLVEVVRLARMGLNNQGTPAEAAYLDTLDLRLGGDGGCPARRLLRAWDGEMQRDPARLVEHLSRNTLRDAA